MVDTKYFFVFVCFGDGAFTHLRRWAASDGGQLDDDNQKVVDSEGSISLHLRKDLQSREHFQPAQALRVRGGGAELRLPLSRMHEALQSEEQFEIALRKSSQRFHFYVTGG